MNKVYKSMGKRGRTTIPYAMRVFSDIKQGDILSFEQKDKNTIIVKKEAICPETQKECQTAYRESVLKQILQNMTPEERDKVFLRLLTQMYEGKV